MGNGRSRGLTEGRASVILGRRVRDWDSASRQLTEGFCVESREGDSHFLEHLFKSSVDYKLLRSVLN